MKVLVLGVVRMHGVSTKTGSPKPYDMTRISYCVPVQIMETTNRTMLGHGFEVRDLDLDPQALADFRDIKFPAQLDLVVEVDPANLRRNICNGIAKP